MIIEISDSILQKIPISAQELKTEIAVSLYERQILTLEQASKLADKDQLSFQKLLGSKGIALHYAVEDFEQDLETLKNLNRID